MREEPRLVGFSNDLVFNYVMDNSRIACALISCLIGKTVSKIAYMSTQQSEKAKPGTRGIRMDVYAEGEGEWYDIEMQATEMEEPGLRCRLYQGVNDVAASKSGDAFRKLKRSWIIFMCKEDPFAEDLREEDPGYGGDWRYEFGVHCPEHPTLDIGANMTWLFLVSSQWEKADDPQVAELLEYMDKGKPRKFPGGLVEEIHRQVVAANMDRGDWRQEMITYEEKIASNLRAARKKAEAKGLAEGEAKRKAQTSALKAAMAADGRLEEFLASIDDEALFESLLAEYGIG